ncbi:MAG TPA: 6-pyruvoyl-tetrahydropterin synthase-related protein [Chloroflexota bacterium]
MVKHWQFGVGLLLSVSLLWPLVVAPYFSHQDNVQTMRIYEMHQCIVDLQIPCRWVPDLGGGYGNPLFNYYAPLPYYVGELFYLTTHNVITAAKLTFATGFVAAFVFMYLFARRLWGELGGSLSAIFYVLAPYHARNMYIRGAMGELWAMAAFPLVFWAFLRLRDRMTAWNALLLGGAVALLMVSHNLSAALFFGVLALIAALHVWSSRQFTYARYLVLAVLWAIALSAFYLFPMLLETGAVHLETMTINELNYAEQFQGLRTLLVEQPWWSASVYYQIGTLHVLVWALSLFAVWRCWRKNTDLRFIVLPLSLVIVVCIYMITPASAWIWDRIGPLSLLQFPWRLLSLISFGTATAAGAIMLLVRNHTARLVLWWVLVVLVTALNVGYFRPDRFLNVSQDELLSDGGWDNLRMYAIGDFLPKSVQVAPRQPAEALYEQVSGQSDITDPTSGSNWVRFDATSRSDAVVQINKFDFPNWEVTVDGQPVAHSHDDTTGAIQVSLPAGAHTIAARLRDTPIRIAGNIVSALALLLLAILILRCGILQDMVDRSRSRITRQGSAQC